jgi:hypothetical protein
MDNIDDEMLPVLGFRAVLNASYKSETLNPEEITSYEWFHHRWKRSSECIPVDVAAADIAIKKFCGYLWSGDIRPIGSLVYPTQRDRGWISRTDIFGPPGAGQVGELHVFDQVLDVLKRGLVIRRYELVNISRTDVARTVRRRLDR